MKKWMIILLVLSMFVFVGCGGGNGGNDDSNGSEGVEIPAEVEAVMDKVTGIAAEYALLINGEWADTYAEMLASGEGTDHPEFDNLKATLDQFRIESGAYYVYVLTDMDPDDDFFEITVDGSEDPDDFLYQYEIEGQFFVAQSGEPAAALSAWDDDEDDPVWSAFAPIYDSDGNVVGILGIDYPAPEILDFPEWNRVSDEWNGMEVDF